MIAYGIIRIIRDFVLFFVFSYRFWPRARSGIRETGGKTIVILLGIFVIASLYTVLFGRDAFFDLGIMQTPIKICAFAIIYFLLFRYFFHLPFKVSALESLIFTISLRAGQMLYTEVIAPLVTEPSLSFLSQDTIAETLLVAVFDLAFVAALVPKEDEVDESSVSVLQIALLMFALLDYLVIRLAYFEGLSEGWGVVANAFQCLCLFVFCYIAKRTVAYNYHQGQMHRMNALVEAEYANMLQRQRNDEKMRVMYHDLKHALAVLGTKEDAARIMGSLENTFGAARGIAYTKNAILNVVLNEKVEDAKCKGIHLEVVPNIGDCDFIDDFDIVTLFGNVLSNAIEAVEMVEKEKDRWIRFEAAEYRSRLIFRTSNPYCVPLVDSGGSFASTKKDRDEHGLGLISIRRCAEKYDGTVQVDGDGGLFTIIISLPCPVLSQPR